MAEEGVYSTNTLVGYKAGAKCSATSKAEAYTNEFLNEAEGYINSVCNHVFAADSTAFTALPAGTKKILSECASNLAAIYVINYDLSGFTTRYEAEDMINVLYKRAMDDIEILKIVAKTDFVAAGA